MTYFDLIRDADRKLDKGDITLGEYDKMIEPLNREIDHIAESGRMVERTAETAQNVKDEDLISRKAAIEALARMMPRSYTPDGSHPADEEIFRAQEIFADCIEALEILPPAQPATNCSEIPNGSDDTISRQAAIDALHMHLMYRMGTDSNKKRLDEWINSLPSAQPEQRWIPSGENPPKEGSYLVWMPFAPPEYRIAVAERCDGYWNIKTPISAWMPLPEPYRGGDA